MCKLRMLALFIFVFSLNSCAQKIMPTYEDNVELDLNINRIENCFFFCNFLEVTITNNNSVGVYMPMFEPFELLNIVNSNEQDIFNNLFVYESLNESSNLNLKSEDSLVLNRIKELENAYNPFDKDQNSNLKILDAIFKNDVFTDFNSKSQLSRETLNGFDDFIKNEILDVKYSPIAFVPANSSKKLFIPINYLFQNFVVEGHPITPFYLSHGNPEEKEIFEHNYSGAWENYEGVRTDRVKIVLKYDCEFIRSNTWESNSYNIPYEYFTDTKDSITVSKKYPTKLLDKYFLVKSLQSDTLAVDLPPIKK